MVCVVRVHYKSTNSLSRVPIVGNMARYMAFPQGAMTTLAISLAPYWNQMDFPVVPQAGKGFNLNFRIVGVAPAAELRIESVEARYMEVPPENAPFLEGVDQVWIDGLPQH